MFGLRREISVPNVGKLWSILLPAWIHRFRHWQHMTACECLSCVDKDPEVTQSTPLVVRSDIGTVNCLPIICHQSPSGLLETAIYFGGLCSHDIHGLCPFHRVRVVGVRTRQALGVPHSAHFLSGSVEVAVAVLLVICIIVVVAILGYFFFKSKKKDFHRHRRHHPPPTPASSTVSTTEDTEHLVYNHTTRPL